MFGLFEIVWFTVFKVLSLATTCLRARLRIYGRMGKGSHAMSVCFGQGLENV